MPVAFWLQRFEESHRHMSLRKSDRTLGKAQLEFHDPSIGDNPFDQLLDLTLASRPPEDLFSADRDKVLAGLELRVHEFHELRHAAEVLGARRNLQAVMAPLFGLFQKG